MSLARFRRFWRARDGATAVEFAMVAGPLLLLLFGMIEFGRVLWLKNALQETAIAGARCMGVRQTACTSNGAYSAANSISFVEATAKSWNVALQTSNVSVNNAATCAGMSNFSQVTITYDFQTVAPQVISALAGGLPITVDACFPNRPP